MKTLNELNASPKVRRPSSKDVDPLTVRTEYRVGHVGGSYAGRTGEKLHIIKVEIVVAFDAEKEARACEEYPLRKSIRWPKVGDVAVAHGVCRTSTSRGGMSYGVRCTPIDGLDTNDITCSGCLKKLSKEVL